MARRNKAQHKVPATYLSAFTDEKGVVWVSDAKDQKVFASKPTNVLTESDYYTVRFPGGGGTLVVETEFLGGVEGSYANLYREKIKNKLPLNDNDKATMAIFVASMYERSPHRRAAMEKMFADVRSMTERMRSAVASMTEDEKRAFAAAQPMPTEESRKNSIPADELLKLGEDVGSLHSSGIPEMVASIAPIFYEMKWSFVVRSEGEPYFLTSESPVVSVIPSLHPRSIYQGGLAHKDVEVTFPLSPDLALFAGWKLTHDRFYLPAPRETIEELNRRLIQRSGTLVSNDKTRLEAEAERLSEYLKSKKTPDAE